MLAIARRALGLGRRGLASTPGASPLFSSHFVIGSSKDLDRPFSTSSASWNGIRTKPSKAALAETRKKLEQKRTNRAVKKLNEEAKDVEQAYVAGDRAEELEQKRMTAEQLAEGLDPYSDVELASIYQGLILAPPEDFVQLGLPAPESQLLLDQESTSDRDSREGRLDALEARMSEGLQSYADELEPVIVEGLAERLQARREVENLVPSFETAVVGEDSAPALKLLARLESIIFESESVAEAERSVGEEDEIPFLGVAVRSEWKDIALACAEANDMEGVKKSFALMKRAGIRSDGLLLSQIMESYADRGRARDCLALAQHAKTEALPLTVSSHHHLISSLLPSHPVIAINHLHSLEAVGFTPLLETYTLLIRSLLAPGSPTHLVSRGWDLYAHTRLVSHPTPDVPLFSTMIQACSVGPHPSPERAMDLFTEMTTDNNLPPSEEAYNGVIRSCAREGSQAFYFEALRFMRQMLDANVSPSRQTFHALLEGAKRHGDLARARWMLVKMIGVGGRTAPNSSTMGLIFQTYAAYKPPVVSKGRVAKVRSVRVERSSSSSTLADDSILRTSLSTVAASSSTSISPASSSSTTSLSDSFDESSLFYPGAMPETTEQLLMEAHGLMAQCVGSAALASTSTNFTASPLDALGIERSATFSQVEPSPFLLNAYNEFLCAHAPADVTIEFFNTAYKRLGVEKNKQSFERMIKSCETGKNRSMATKNARDVFQEWINWSKGMNMAVDEGTEGAEKDLEGGTFGVSRITGANISWMWASMIRVLARNFEDQVALKLLQTFIATYPPLNLVTHSHDLRKAVRALPAQPSAVRLSDSLYPETTTSSRLDRPPYLLYDDIKVLHLRLANVEDVRALAVVKGVCRAYERALQTAKDYEENKVKVSSLKVHPDVRQKDPRRRVFA